MSEAPDVSRALAALRLDPRTTDLVPRVVSRMYGPVAIGRWVDATKGFTCLGMLPTDADVAGLMVAVGREQVLSIAKAGPIWAETKAKGLPQLQCKGSCPISNAPENIAGWFTRGATAFFTVGASEVARAVSDDAEKFLNDIEGQLEKGFETVGDIVEAAASEGWKVFKKSLQEIIDNLDVTNIDSFNDVFDLALTIATGGLHQVVNEGINYIQDKIWELIAPYIARVGEAIGEAYANGKQATKEAIYTWMDNWDAPKVVAEIIWQVVSSIWDIIFGYPPCVCEKACIQPIAKALKDAGNPYVKIVGQILSVLWPVCQGAGDYGLDFPEISACMYMYAGSNDGAGIKLLPAAKLNTKDLKTVINIVKILDEDAGKAISKFGLPTAYDMYKPYLVDEIARGKIGPQWLGGEPYNRTARWYFEHPEDAKQVLETASLLGDVLGYVTQYLEYLNTVAEYAGYAKKGYDTYQAIQSGQFSSEITMEDLADYAKQKGLDLAKTAEKKAEDLAKQAKEKGTSIKDQAQAFLDSGGKNVLQWDRETAREAIVSAGRGAISGFGAVDHAHAFMGEWMLAELGLAARQKYNLMVQMYVTELDTSGWLSAEVKYVNQHKRKKYRDQCLKELGIDDPCDLNFPKRERALNSYMQREYAKCRAGQSIIAPGSLDKHLFKCMVEKRKAEHGAAERDAHECFMRHGMRTGESMAEAWGDKKQAARDAATAHAAILACSGGGAKPRAAWGSGPKEWKETGTDWSAWEKYLSTDSKVQSYVQYRRMKYKRDNEIIFAKGKAVISPKTEAVPTTTSGKKVPKVAKLAPEVLQRFEEGVKPVSLPTYLALKLEQRTVGGGRQYGTGKQPAGPGKKTGAAGKKGLLILGALALGVGVYYATKKKR